MTGERRLKINNRQEDINKESTEERGALIAQSV
jgi:hypothetical protein